MSNLRVRRRSGASATGGLLVDPSRVRDLRPEVLDQDGRLRVLPAAFWAGTTREERALLGHSTGSYGFPTVELVAHLKALIGDRSAIEIGAGNGVLAEALGIPATDNRQQEMPEYAARILAAGQPPVRYGPNIIRCDAHEAVRQYQPDVVVACWVTHRYDPARPEAGGNELGVDEADIIRNCAEYVLVGNAGVHRHKPIWKLPHEIEYPRWLYSRATNGSRDFIARWEDDDGALEDAAAAAGWDPQPWEMPEADRG
jgi:hypothetical protein